MSKFFTIILTAVITIVVSPAIAQTPINAPSVTAVPNGAPSMADYKNALGFELTDNKMMAFAGAAYKIDQINRKWDMMISSAPTDSMAVEYNNLSMEEVASAMAKMPDISVEEYNKIFTLSAEDKEFYRLVSLYQQRYRAHRREQLKQEQDMDAKDNQMDAAPIVDGTPSVGQP